MRLVQRLCFVVLLSSLAAAQTSAPGGSNALDLQNDVKKLLDAVASQTKAIAAQQKAIEEQQKQIIEQNAEIERLKQQLTSSAQAVSANDESQPAHIVNATLNAGNTNPGARPASDLAQEDRPKDSPLSFRIGQAEFTPGGFVDFENIFRSTNTGNVATTNYSAIPYSNTVAGHMTEFRSTGQYSRFNIKVTDKFGKNDVTGYVEFDFNGNDAANVFVTTNGHTDRLRLYWLDLKRGKWEFLGGQTWGLQTPNRVGVSPTPADLSLGFNEDAAVGVGYNYTRAAEFRAAYHFNDHWVWAVAMQNPQQYVGAGEVTYPFVFNAQLGGQFDAGNVSGAPNVAPDILTKITYDHNFGPRHFHWEAGGMETAVKATVLPTALGSSFASHSTVGGGLFGGVAADITKNVRFVASGMWGYGVGRYLNGLAPQAVVVPIQTGAATFDARTSMVHAGDVVSGFEFLPHPKAQFGVYYGGAYAGRNAFPDVSSPAVGAPHVCATGQAATLSPCIGFGGLNSPNSANRAIQQGTFDWIQTFWKNPQYGAVLLVTQYSYLTRAPWFVPAGAPKNAHLSMAYVSLRYQLP